MKHHSALNIVRWVSIICALLAATLLGGCSAARLGYSNAPALTYWWLDSYFDFDTAQSDLVRADLAAALEWHRKEELPLLADALKTLQTTTQRNTTPEQLCAAYGSFKRRFQAGLERLAPTIAAVAPSLQPQQMDHIAKEMDKRNRDWREEWLDGTPAERNQRRMKVLRERLEFFYGSLSSAQLAQLQSDIHQSDFDPHLVYREKLRRHQDAMQVLGTLRTQPSTPKQARQQIQGLLQRSLNSPDPVYSRYLDRATLQACSMVSTLHNSASPVQRSRLQETLQAYEQDARTL